jgi:DNA-binding MarR family transcriptional regulator
VVEHDQDSHDDLLRLFARQLLQIKLLSVKHFCYARSVTRNGLPDELPDDLATFWRLVRRLAGLMDREGDALCRRELGISLPQFLVLSVVDAHPGRLSQQAIADRLGLTKGTVSRQIDNAVSAGLMTVRVAPHTRREHAVALTSAGAAIVRKGDALLADARDALRESLDSRQLPVVISALQAAVQTIERENSP